jgi:hypothetical protein
MSPVDLEDLAIALWHRLEPDRIVKELINEYADMKDKRDFVESLRLYNSTETSEYRDALLFYLFKNRSLEIWGPWLQSFKENPTFEVVESYRQFITATISTVRLKSSISVRLGRLLDEIKASEDLTKWLLDSLNQKKNIERLVAHGSPALRYSLRKYLSNMVDYPGVNLKTNANLARYMNSPGRFTGGRRSTKKTKRRQSRQSRQSQSKRRRQ